MIQSHCFTREWIDGFKRRKEFRSLNPPVLEKMIQALYLLQNLKLLGMDFVFKGGTSLVLLMEKTWRFSVDIDLITQHKRVEIECILDAVVASSHFEEWKLDERRSYKAGVPKAHYELRYQSNYNQNSNYVLLDLLFEESHYPALLEAPVSTEWIETTSEVKVSVPSIESILGDKLTAFAPTTTGILYGKGKGLEIVKQLFDIGNLIEQVKDLAVVAEGYAAFVKQEISYRGLTVSHNDVLLDTLKACKVLTLRGKNRLEPERSQFRELQNGIRSFNNFLFSESFHLEDALLAAAKVAWLVTRLLHQEYGSFSRPGSLSALAPQIGDPEWSFLNKLRKLPKPDAFAYWCMALRTQSWKDLA